VLAGRSWRETRLILLNLARQAHNVTVRRLEPDDWELLREVRLRALADAPEAFGSTYARELGYDQTEWRRRAGSSAWFLATDDQSVLGIVAGYRDPRWLPDRRPLVAMWVAPQARGSGVAAQLVDAVMTWARDDAATELILGVVDSNARARALYVKCGFASTGQREPHHSDASRSIEILALTL
jgi:RimJ/RimL family protein N-acetyltransferase